MSRAYFWRMLPLAASLLLLRAAQAQAPTVPDKMLFCGMKLSLSPEAQAEVQKQVDNIFKSPPYYSRVVDRGDTYLPYVEEAFDNVGVPKDLRYLVIQESGLQPDAVSKSNAVGFWQLKADAAAEMGLRVNDNVDERRHIYRASEAAARYLAKGNNDFNNWLYAVIAYYEGLTGAVKYTDPTYYGAVEMKVDKDLHWYALKAIAHKVAYEPAYLQPRQPRIWLEPFATQGVSSVKAILESHKIMPDKFFYYNTWMLNREKLPKEQQFSYFIPHENEPYTGHHPDPTKVPGGGVPVYVKPVAAAKADPLPIDPQPVATATPAMPPNPSTPRPNAPAFAPAPLPMAPPAIALRKPDSTQFVEFGLRDDINYGQLFALFDGRELVSEIADRYRKSLVDLIRWNGLIPGVEPPAGTILYLEKPNKTLYHIVRPGENLAQIAAFHGLKLRKLQKNNRLRKDDYAIYEGQKLYLQSPRPAGEKIILLRDAGVQYLPKPTAVAAVPKPQPRPATPAQQPPQPPAAQPSPSVAQPPIAPERDAQGVQVVRTKWVEHTVVAGESIWTISQKYGTKVEIIKQTNKLTDDTLKPGQVLRVLAKENMPPK